MIELEPTWCTKLFEEQHEDNNTSLIGLMDLTRSGFFLKKYT